MHFNKADISEKELLETFGEEVFRRLLRDRSTFVAAGSPQGRDEDYRIMWATKDYEPLGEGYGEKDLIRLEQVTGDNDRLIMPRAVKSREQQKLRTQKKAEVFTPSWVCNKMNNMLDEAFFGRKDVFNTLSQNEKEWTETPAPIVFTGEGEMRDWQEFVAYTHLEITCGEAPFVVSRYDTTTGELIPLRKRIGFLDRKMRVVNENCHTEADWLPAARRALQSVYGYEWQGDSLLLARENVFVSMMEYYQAKFGEDRLPDKDEVLVWAHIISWNFFQMDALKFVVPMSCHDEVSYDLFGNETRKPCPGCKLGFAKGKTMHNGIQALVMDWPPMGVDGDGRIDEYREPIVKAELERQKEERKKKHAEIA